LLQVVAERIHECLRETDTISRLGGDEFLIIISDVRDTQSIIHFTLKVIEKFSLPFDVEGHELSTTASIGISIYPDNGADQESLLKHADAAMYQAKISGRNTYRFFTEEMNASAADFLHIRNDLEKALIRQEFVLHYQPQISLGKGRPVGVEALIRWNHPTRGELSPCRFIPIAESSGLIVPIGNWVLQEACRQAVAWRAMGLCPVIMGVNLSAVQLRRGDLVHAVSQALNDSGLDAAALELELTESILVQDTDSALTIIQDLKALGIRLSIDDFGTGYSCLAYLKRFDVDRLKIDQSFVRDINADSNDDAIVHAIIQMAHSLGLKTIAEGVESLETLNAVANHGCDEVQGYYFSRPVPADQMREYLASFSAMDEV
jgi:predicted signal transduction protein with EAL and GGDEF domain